MKEYFTAKIKYLKQDQNDGTIKQVSEVYALNAYTHTEAEARLQTILQEFIPEFNLLKLDKTNLQDVIVDESKDYFFKVKVCYVSVDPDSGKEQKINELYLVQAENTKGALNCIENRLKGSIMDCEIPAISKTNIIDFFPYISEEEN
tara:strand:+ start:211 stop:651 length:441 start_codon:yes stop_codon:yes gene_type:complete